jgi:hypothetical protein
MRKAVVDPEYLPFWETIQDTYLIDVEVCHQCRAKHLGQILVPTPENLAGSFPQLQMQHRFRAKPNPANSSYIRKSDVKY